MRAPDEERKGVAMQVYYCDHHQVPLPPGHRFPMSKYRRLRLALLDAGVLAASQLVPAAPAPAELVARVHEPAYVHAVLAGTLPPRELRKIGFPWSPELVARCLASVHGTVLAAQAALAEGMAGNLAGGTHHAFRDHGSGFCVFNDIAVAAQALLDAAAVTQVLVIDADVHQGDGTAAIFRDRPEVFTCSIHGAKNFPFHKQESDLDIALDDGATDEVFLDALMSALARCFERCAPDIVFYQAGVDGLREDVLGRLSLTREGLRQRDALVIDAARSRGIPIALTLGGGYADPIDATIEAHAGTYQVARSRR